MSGRNAPATPVPPHRAPLHGPLHGPAAHGRPARRPYADGNRRPVVERCGHHSGGHSACHPSCAPAAAPPVAPPASSPLWRTMMERWLTASS
ncbi:hypothetical protein [Azospirillum sp. B510]|uniref:hypothetical protein n=1 Tax=Azospirillum sp. (strain B510) TaxID=137722 RepID=UPI0011D0F58F|nr:hypothetical protein [Azospirillum sp. B510]